MAEINVQSTGSFINNYIEQKRASSNYAQNPINTQIKDQFVKTKIDKSNNGKFDILEAAKNFGKGIISPVTEMFSSKKSFLIGAGMLLGGIALTVATGGAILPAFVALGVATGAVQAGACTYKIIKAKNGDDVEKAFYDAGAATGTIGLSVMGAKASLKQTGVLTEGMNPFSATVECFKQTPASIGKSFKSFSKGSAAVKPPTETPANNPNTDIKPETPELKTEPPKPEKAAVNEPETTQPKGEITTPKFNTVAEAEDFAKKEFNFHQVSYGDDLEFANIANEAFMDLKKAGFGDDMKRLNIEMNDCLTYAHGEYYSCSRKELIELEQLLPDFIKENQSIIYDGEIHTINFKTEHNWKKEMNNEFVRGFKSTNTPKATVFHEFGHYLHNYYNKNYYKQSLLNNISSEKLKIITDKTLPEMQPLIEEKVSRYASVNPLEFVAEVFAGLMDGKEYDSQIMNLYRDLGGPIPSKQSPANIGKSRKFIDTPQPAKKTIGLNPEEIKKLASDAYFNNNRAPQDENWIEGKLINLGSKGENFDAHGIAKGSTTEQLKALDYLLTKGIDPNRSFYTAPLDVETSKRAGMGAAVGTSGGTAYTDGGFIVVAQKGKSINADGISYVIVNKAFYQGFDTLQKAYPNVKFIKMCDVNQFFEKL